MIARGLIAAFADAGNTAPDVGALLAELNNSFAAFKDSKEKEIAALQQGSEEAKAAAAKADAEMAGLRASIDDLAVQMAASQMNGGAGKLDKEAQAAVDATVSFMRSGEVRADLKNRTIPTAAIWCRKNGIALLPIGCVPYRRCVSCLRFSRLRTLNLKNSTICTVLAAVG